MFKFISVFLFLIFLTISCQKNIYYETTQNIINKTFSYIDELQKITNYKDPSLDNLILLLSLRQKDLSNCPIREFLYYEQIIKKHEYSFSENEYKIVDYFSILIINYIIRDVKGSKEIYPVLIKLGFNEMIKQIENK